MASPTTRDVHVDAVLTNLSIAYRNPNYIADQVFPAVQVNKQSDVYFVYGRAAWLRNEAAIRAPGAKSQSGDYEITTASYFAMPWFISHVLPDEVRENADNPIRPELESAEWVTDGLLRAQEIRVAAKTTGGSGLWTYSATPSVIWTSDTSDPLGDIDNAVNSIVSNTGQMPNVAVMSWDVWRALRIHPDLLDRIKYTRPGSQVQPSDLNTWFGFGKVLIGSQLYDPAKEGASSSPTYIWGDQFWCGYVPQQASLMQPAAGYTVQWGTRQINRFRLDEEHSDKFEAGHYTAEIISASESGAVLYNCT